MIAFEQRAVALGLSPQSSFAGMVTIPTLDKLKEILNISGTSPTHASMVEGVAPASPDSIDAIGDAVARHVYGDDAISDADRALAETVFPLRVFVVSQADKTINSEWNLNQQSGDGPVIISLGTLTVQDGGYVTIANRTLDFTVDTLIRQGTAAPPNNMGLFNVLGATGAKGADGTTPTAPGQAQSGNPGNCSSAGIAGASGGNGTGGSQGSTGNPGDPGNPGKASLPATIRITTAVQSSIQLPVLTQSGAGGPGGTGGTGSKGGRGGNGGDGATCGCTGSAGGSGAQGGKGGTGGTGGQGGNAVDAAGNITVYVPAAAAGQFVPIKLTAQPGPGGARGVGGAGGDGGSAGSGGKHNSGGSSGGTGGQGDSGTAGTGGTLTGKPAEIFIQPV